MRARSWFLFLKTGTVEFFLFFALCPIAPTFFRVSGFLLRARPLLGKLVYGLVYFLETL